MFRAILNRASLVGRGLHTACSSTVPNSQLLSSSYLLSKQKIIDCPLIKTPFTLPTITGISNCNLPTYVNPVQIEDVSLPHRLNIITPLIEPVKPVKEIRAAELVQIRKQKMKKHKLKKLRKRMRFLWAKLRLRREKKKELLFKEELMSQITEAQNFNAEKYVVSVLGRIRNRYEHIETPEQKREKFMELMRKHRSNVQWIKPKLD